MPGKILAYIVHFGNFFDDTVLLARMLQKIHKTGFSVIAPESVKKESFLVSVMLSVEKMHLFLYCHTESQLLTTYICQ